MSFYYNDVLIPQNHGALGGFALLNPIPGICPVSNGDLRWLLDPHPILCILVIITVTMPLSFLNSNFMNYGHIFCMSAPLVMDKMRLLFKRANKIHVLLFITNFHLRIIVIFNPQTTHQFPQPMPALGPLQEFRFNCAAR